MSKRIGSLYHPTSKEPTDIYSGFNWPCLFFGPLWFAVKGMWLWAVASFVLAWVSFGFSMFIFPFLSNGMHKKHLRNNGWLTEDQAKGGQSSSQQSNTSTFSQPLASVNLQAQPSPSVPQIGQTSTTTMPTAGINIAQPQQPPVALGSFRSKSFVFAKLKDSSISKNEYDVLDAEAGALFLEIREGESGTGTKIARMGTLSTVSGFDVMFKTIDGQPCFRIKGGGIGGGGEIFNQNDVKIGSLKKATLTNNFELLDSQGNATLNTKQKMMSFNQQIFKQGQEIGVIKDISKSEAKEILGGNFDRLNSVKKYDYAYHLSVNTTLDDLEQALLLCTTYCFAHISGRM